MRASTLSYSASVMSGTESSSDGTPGLRFIGALVAKAGDCDFLPEDVLGFFVFPPSLPFLEGVLRFFGVVVAEDLGVFDLIISLLLLTLEGLLG